MHWPGVEGKRMDEAKYREAEQRLWGSIGATPTEHRVHLERNDVTVRLQEVGEGPVVIFLHGANTSGSSWATLVGRLPGFRCMLLDRPGTGLSEPLETVLDADSLGRFADTLVIDVLDALRVASAHLVATSFGGYIALRTAAAHPDRIGRMVQFSWPVGAPIARLPVFMRMMSIPMLGRLFAAVPPNERAVRMMFRRIGHGQSLEAGRITREDLDCYLALLRFTDTMRNELAVGRAFISPVRGLDHRLVLPDSILATIQAPTCFLWGENDPFGNVDTARQLVDRMPNAELELLPGGGHAPWLDDLDHTAKITSAFLSH
jgi:2-hydroxy-6-oxonona-2,4-dienedioate hydrolase